MKVNPIAVLGFLALATMISFLFISGLQREPESVSITVLDGTGMSGAEILNAAYFLSSELPVKINFNSNANSSDSITAMSRKGVSNSPVDAISLEIRKDEFHLNEQIVSGQELRSRLEILAESVRLTESLPFLLLSDRDETSGAQLTNLLQILYDCR